MNDYTIVFQAGGQSSRMGQDKALVPLAGKPIIEHIIERVGSLAENHLLITNSPQNFAYLGLPLASDADPGAGALPGLKTALENAATRYIVLVACDMPFVNRELLQYQMSLAENGDVIVPLWQGYHQTMHAVYARLPVLVAVEDALAAGKRRMISFYPQVKVVEVGEPVITRFDPDGRTFFNVNTPEELEEAERMIRGG